MIVHMPDAVVNSRQRFLPGFPTWRSRSNTLACAGSCERQNPGISGGLGGRNSTMKGNQCLD